MSELQMRIQMNVQSAPTLLRRRRRPFANSSMWRRTTTVAVAVATLVIVMISSADALEIKFRNECGKDIVLFNGRTSDNIKRDSSLKKTLPVGAVEAFRMGTSNQATLAEFSVQEATTWYDISIIPTGRLIGPGNCTSLADCKAVTGGTGFNVAMKIVPGLDDGDFFGDTCMTVNCFEDGCEDAYLFPEDPRKTRNCPSSVHFTVVFCATPATGSSDGSLGWNGSLESAVISDTAAPMEQPLAALPSPETRNASTSHGADDGGGSSVAVIVAAIIGGLVTVFAAMVVIPRLHHLRLEKMNRPRESSDAILYVEVREKGSL